MFLDQSVKGSKGSFVFDRSDKSQFLDYGKTTRKVNISGILFPSSSKQKGKNTWSQVTHFATLLQNKLNSDDVNILPPTKLNLSCNKSGVM